MIPTPTKTPASMIEDGYAIDLVPWWKYLWQRLNPWHRRPRTEMRWIGWISIHDEWQQWNDFWERPGTPKVLVLSRKLDGTPAISLLDSTYQPFLYALANPTHFCPVPSLPEEYKIPLPPLP